MSQSLKIAIVGDFDFTYNSHHATNMAVDHSAYFLEVDINYYWIKLSEIVKFKSQQFNQYDGFLFAPGPVKNPFFLHGIIKEIINRKIPTLITGEGFKILLEVLINKYRLNSYGEKQVSDNLVDGKNFNKITILPHSKEFIQLYENYSNIELTSARYSMYPQLISELQLNNIADIEAYNQFEDPEIISLQNHDFFVGCGFCPQISSTRERPHPVIYTFFKACVISLEKTG
ncbi:MAG TPA: hypothetical protein EYG86_04990 [Crocinitomicaceae bacterium]|nr:hypothetical protein [Crocinitomicaceae bacterium]